MTAPSKNLHPHHHQQPSSSRPPRNPNTNCTTNCQNHNPNPNLTYSISPNSPITVSDQEQFLSRASHLTRQEVLRRRSHNLKQLAKCYRDHYWALMEEVKIQYREYYWKYGVSPFKEDHPLLRQKRKQGGGSGLERESGEREGGNVNIEVIGENNNNSNNGNGNIVGSNSNGDFDMKNNHRCLFVGCKLKAMALTSFCHLHILSDAKQKLYKPCGYVIKSAQAGPITCGKPILRSSAPSLCTVHFQKAQKHVTRALKKAGLNVSSSSKLAPKFHVIVAEYVRQIQTKRKAAERANRNKGLDKETSTS